MKIKATSDTSWRSVSCKSSVEQTNLWRRRRRRSKKRHVTGEGWQTQKLERKLQVKSLRTCVQRLERRYHSSDQHERLFTLKKDGRRKEIENNVAAIANLISSLPKKEKKTGNTLRVVRKIGPLNPSKQKRWRRFLKKRKRKVFYFILFLFFFWIFGAPLGYLSRLSETIPPLHLTIRLSVFCIFKGRRKEKRKIMKSTSDTRADR